MGSMPARSNSVRWRTPLRLALTRGRPAFTLIELVVVLVLMGISLAVVVPAIWKASTSDAANALAAPVVSLLRFAQRTAAQRNDVVTVSIDPTTNSYQVRTMRADTVMASGKFAFMTNAHFLTDSARLHVTFRPAGGADADSLLLSDPGGVLDLRVDPWTGTINVVHR